MGRCNGCFVCVCVCEQWNLRHLHNHTGCHSERSAVYQQDIWVSGKFGLKCVKSFRGRISAALTGHSHNVRFLSHTEALTIIQGLASVKCSIITSARYHCVSKCYLDTADVHKTICILVFVHIQHCLFVSVFGHTSLICILIPWRLRRPQRQAKRKHKKLFSCS